MYPPNTNDGDLEAFLIGERDGLRKRLNDIEDRRSLEIAALVSVTADRDAYKALLETILYENAHPEEGRRFTGVNATEARAKLLREAHRSSFEACLTNPPSKTLTGVGPQTTKSARKFSENILQGYAEASNRIGSQLPKVVEKLIETEKHEKEMLEREKERLARLPKATQNPFTAPGASKKLYIEF